MNIDTGELRRIREGESIPDGYIELNEDEQLEAIRELHDKEAAMLDESNKLRKSVTERYNGMNRQQRRKAESEQRKIRKKH